MKIRALVDISETQNNVDPVLPWLQWRIKNPFEHLNLRYCSEEEKVDAQLTWYQVGSDIEEDVDILILPRIVVAPNNQELVSKWFEKIRSGGTKLVYELDDDIFSESYVSHGAKQHTTPETSILPLIGEFEQRARAALWTLRQCDAVTTSTKSLGLYVQTLTSIPVYVIPNAIDKAKFDRGLVERLPSAYYYIGWAGGRRNETDIEAMVEGWLKLTENPKMDHVRFILGGYTPKLISDRREFDGRAVGLGWKPMAEYASSMQVDIGCCSVNDTPFNRRKSPIKSWEYALAGACVVASDIVYEEEPVVVLAHDAKDWTMLLEFLVQNRSTSTALAQMFKNHVEFHHTLEFQYSNWYNTYKDILDNDVEKVAM